MNTTVPRSHTAASSTPAVDDWSPELARKIASACGIELGIEHWAVIAACREETLRCGCIPTLERLAILSGTTETRIRDIFLIDPETFISRVAGFSYEPGRGDATESSSSKGVTP